VRKKKDIRNLILLFTMENRDTKTLILQSGSEGLKSKLNKTRRIRSAPSSVTSDEVSDNSSTISSSDGDFSSETDSNLCYSILNQFLVSTQSRDAKEPRNIVDVLEDILKELQSHRRK
jgi:hypothetical protein